MKQKRTPETPSIAADEVDAFFIESLKFFQDYLIVAHWFCNAATLRQPSEYLSIVRWGSCQDPVKWPQDSPSPLSISFEVIFKKHTIPSDGDHFVWVTYTSGTYLDWIVIL